MLRVATYNVHDCIGRDGHYAPQRIAEVVSGLRADVVALQEVTLDHAGDVVAGLENATAMRAVDGTLFERGVGRYGNLLLSRLPIARQQLHDLSVAGREPRGLIDVLLTSDDGEWRVLATHLGLRRQERGRQLEVIADLLSHSDAANILLGDFNVWFGERPFAPLHRAGMVPTRLASYPTWSRPVLRLDRVFVDAAGRIEAGWCHVNPITAMASDHYPVVADIARSNAAV